MPSKQQYNELFERLATLMAACQKQQKVARELSRAMEAFDTNTPLRPMTEILKADMSSGTLSEDEANLLAKVLRVASPGYEANHVIVDECTQPNWDAYKDLCKPPPIPIYDTSMLPAISCREPSPHKTRQKSKRKQVAARRKKNKNKKTHRR